ncbi:MAG: hypothetical protein R6U65_13340 [Perlabentimonas sp.]
MKTIKKIIYMLVLTFATVTLAVSCQSGADKEKSENEKSEFEKTRHETMVKLQEVRDDIDYRINDIDRRLQDASGEMKDGLQGAKDALTQERSKIDKVMYDVKNATQETWDDVSKFTEESYEKAKRETKKVAEDIEEWFEKSESE